MAETCRTHLEYFKACFSKIIDCKSKLYIDNLVVSAAHNIHEETDVL